MSCKTFEDIMVVGSEWITRSDSIFGSTGNRIELIELRDSRGPRFKRGENGLTSGYQETANFLRDYLPKEFWVDFDDVPKNTLEQAVIVVKDILTDTYNLTTEFAQCPDTTPNIAVRRFGKAITHNAILETKLALPRISAKDFLAEKYLGVITPTFGNSGDDIEWGPKTPGSGKISFKMNPETGGLSTDVTDELKALSEYAAMSVDASKDVLIKLDNIESMLERIDTRVALIENAHNVFSQSFEKELQKMNSDTGYDAIRAAKFCWDAELPITNTYAAEDYPYKVKNSLWKSIKSFFVSPKV